MGKIAITNIGRIITGDLRSAHPQEDTIVIENGKIAQIGKEDEVNLREITKAIDLKGMTIMPGLIDSHMHPVIGDWSPRFGYIGYVSEMLSAGVTSVISQGEHQIQGRPKDISGIKALAVLARKTFEDFRPKGVKVYAGALILDSKMSESDLQEVSNEGVWLTAEIGIMPISDIEQLIPTVKLARKYGLKIMMHMGGESVPGSKAIGADDILKIMPDVASHVNGGPIAPSLSDVEKLLAKVQITLEVVYGGNPKIAIETVKLAKEKGALDRIIIGSDSPGIAAGLGMGAIMRTIVMISSLADIPANEAVAMATGNTARTFGLREGKIEAGWNANLLAVDGPKGSVGNNATAAIEAGDLPGIAMIMIDGQMVDLPGLMIPPPRRNVSVINH